MLLFIGLALVPPLMLLSLILGGIALGMVVTGGPSPCTPGGGPIVFSDANADAFQLKWTAFDATLDNGSPASVTFNESELSSRVRRALTDDDIESGDRFEGPRICLHTGYGEASARLDLPNFLDVTMKVRGTVEVTDDIVVHVDSIEIGSLPGFVGDWLGEIPERISADISDEHLDHTYQVTLREGEVQIDGQP